MRGVNATDDAGDQAAARAESTGPGDGVSSDVAAGSARWHLTAALGNWLLPGLGHWMIGQRARGLILGVTIGSLYVLGLLIGGIGVIDRAAPLPGFFGQMLIGPTFVVLWAQERLWSWSAIDGTPSLAGGMPIGVMAEQGVLYTSVAGMLNLLCIIDVVYRVGKARGEGGAGVAA
ncbi:MAG: DUF6677 family protein [Planctomycetota bacterium]